jgi:hypothetical protein
MGTQVVGGRSNPNSNTPIVTNSERVKPANFPVQVGSQGINRPPKILLGTKKLLHLRKSDQHSWINQSRPRIQVPENPIDGNGDTGKLTAAYLPEPAKNINADEPVTEIQWKIRFHPFSV